MIFKNCLFSS